MSRQVTASADVDETAPARDADLAPADDFDVSEAAPPPPSPPPGNNAGSGYPLWVRWTALIIFVVVLGTAFIFLGRWQLNRLHERRANNAVIRTNEAAAVAPLTTVADKPITQQQEYRRVKVTGTFEPRNQLIIRYRSNGDAEGYEVVTVMKTSQGRRVPIDRGFIETRDKGDIPDSVSAPPSGKVTLIGRARTSESGKTGATVPVNGHARLINADKISDWIDHPVVDGYLDVVSMHPADTGDFQQIKLPELSDGPHFWYAVQWFMFAGIGATGVVVFIRGDIRERRATEGQPTPSTSSDAAVGGSGSSAAPAGAAGSSAAPAGAAAEAEQEPATAEPAAARRSATPSAAPDSPADTAAPVDAGHGETAERPAQSHPAPQRASRRLRRTKPARPVRYGDTQAPPGWKPPDSDRR